MTLKEASKKSVNGLKEVARKADWRTTHPFWKKVCKVSGVLSGLCWSFCFSGMGIKVNLILAACGVLFGWISGESLIDEMDKNKKSIILRIIKQLLTKSKKS